MQRPGLVLVGVLAAMIGLVMFTTRWHKSNIPYIEKMEKEEAADRMAALKKEQEQQNNPERLNAYAKYGKGVVKGEIEIERVGVVEVELFPEAAPESVAQIVSLAKSGFYNGLRFHRVVKDFVAQVGDPKSKKYKKSDYEGKTSEEVASTMGLGGGGSGKTVPLEKKLPHLINTIGMARSESPDSGDSQFFFNLKDNFSLDSAYCAFGRVVKGQEKLVNIAHGDAIVRFTIK